MDKLPVRVPGAPRDGQTPAEVSHPSFVGPGRGRLAAGVRPILRYSPSDRIRSRDVGRRSPSWHLPWPTAPRGLAGAPELTSVSRGHPESAAVAR
jgi:hypothetical protein